MEEAIIGWLLSQSALTALVQKRINWLSRPQAEALPAITLQRVDGVPERTFSGENGLVQSRIQTDVWAATYGSSVVVSRALKVAMQAASGVRSGIKFHDIIGVNERQSIEGDDPNRFYRISLDHLVWHSPA